MAIASVSDMQSVSGTYMYVCTTVYSRLTTGSVNVGAHDSNMHGLVFCFCVADVCEGG